MKKKNKLYLINHNSSSEEESAALLPFVTKSFAQWQYQLIRITHRD